MLQVARLAPNVLQEAADPVAEFLLGQFDDDGGARDRAGSSDLYYTVFALEGLLALQRPVPVERVGAYLDGFGDGGDLDFVHLCCLARCRAALANARAQATALANAGPDSTGPDSTGGESPAPVTDAADAERTKRLAARIDDHRSDDGGFAQSPGAEHGTVYDAFLATGALQDLGEPVRDPEALAQSVSALALPNGGFANHADTPAATTPTTSAAIALLRQLGRSAPHAAAQWLVARVHPQGGFTAVERAPLPDLLSTATALHALAGCDVPFDAFGDPTLDFLDTLWTGRSFCGSWADDAEDSEYTYYALLSLGHLSLV